MNNIDWDYLVGKSIVKVESFCGPWKAGRYNLTLDTGEVLVVTENEGCGGCGSGWSNIELGDIVNLNHAITRVDYNFDGEDTDTGHLFIYYHDETFDSVQFDEGWGNGYYGGGFELQLLSINKEGN